MLITWAHTLAKIQTPINEVAWHINQNNKHMVSELERILDLSLRIRKWTFINIALNISDFGKNTRSAKWKIYSLSTYHVAFFFFKSSWLLESPLLVKQQLAPWSDNAIANYLLIILTEKSDTYRRLFEGYTVHPLL